MYNFNKQLEIGQKAELKALDYLKRTFSKIVDVRDEPTYQTRGIDFMCWDIGVEVKSDSFNTDLLFFETKRHVERDLPGWLYTCQADIMVWVKPSNILQFMWPQAKEVVLSKLNQYRKVQTKTPVGNSYYSTQGVLVPVADVVGI